ncbi:serine hydrolase [Sinomicrobium pectinilyticum]|uniref:Serine hydrolase n=1 Tax=Sinomicrobium pectinilyticum TaxID=1084421 RepID=A0A3N0ESW2_SINP1|nr:serine hydrolase [Sinomicrobium pectinilyticum]RNL91025.1 serine hydrolase [Sinomicrobium pectinilyticum]
MIRTKKMRHLSTFALLALTGQWCLAQIPEPVKNEIKTRVNNGVYPSVVVGVWEEGKESYFAYGFKNTERKEKADRNTLYEIGSITKTYTGLLLAKFVTEGKLALDFPADTLLPDSIRLRDRKGNPIRLKQLATHTAGLPRLPGNMAPGSADNPYRDYSRQDLLTFLKQYQATHIGARYGYSNLGMGMLGELLAMQGKTDYASLLRKHILSPLKLEYTYVKIPKEKASDIATGYLGNRPVSQWDFKAMAAAGALKTNITDLLHYGKSYLDPESPLKKAAGLTLQTHYTDRTHKKYGLAWHYSGGIAYHNGGTGGFRSFIALNPERKRVVVMITNTGSNSVDDMGMYLAAPEKQKPPVTPEARDIDPEMLQEYAGNYQNNGLGLHMQITVKNGTLHARLPGQPELPVYYYGDHHFFYKNVLARLFFETDENGTVVGLTLQQNGQEILLIKN